MLRLLRITFPSDDVSIHAPRCRGAMLQVSQSPVSVTLFQSTPPVAGGRCFRLSPWHVGHICFNPRPPLPGGDAVSGMALSQSADCFNPRPPLPGGDARRMLKQRHWITVSIHAPRCRGAMLARIGVIVLGFLVSIHAPRCRGAMRENTFAALSPQVVSIHAPRCRGAMLDYWVSSKFIGRFQSTPPVAGGRCGREISLVVLFMSFNPRPPLPGGDARALPKCLRRLCVSIHAPRCRGAMPGKRDFLGRPVYEFQSTPPVAGGRCAAPGSSHRPRRRFNPRPPLPGGDAHLLQLPEGDEQIARIARTILFLSEKYLTRTILALESPVNSGKCVVREPPGENRFTWGSRKLIERAGRRSRWRGSGHVP